MRSVSLAVLALLSACNDTEETVDSDAVVVGPYDVTITWTPYGVPHLVAEDEGSLGYGIGVVMARLHGCTIADRITATASERPRHFGPGPEDAYLDEAFGWLHLGVRAQAEAMWERISQTARDRLVGLTAGYNDVLANEGLAAPCADAPWLRPITHLDALTYAVSLSLDGSGAIFVREVGRAAPPGGASANEAPAFDAPAFQAWKQAFARKVRDPQRGSNGWAIGRDRTATERGMLLSNTHFPAWGEKRWTEMHLTIPGRMDVYGASLVGVPVINLGFNRDVAWTHTVSFSPRFTAYALTLSPDSPTSYVVDGQTRAMEAATYDVEVLGDDGAVETVTRTLYRSEHGPILDVPSVGWTSGLAVAVRDVNADNVGLFDVWHQMNVAESLDDLVRAHTQEQGIPWVYTIATTKEGDAWFGDTSRTPYLTQAQWDEWETWINGAGLTQILARQFRDAGAIVLPGDRASMDWTPDPEARDQGLVPPAKWPVDLRSDYVLNANDSHWLHNAEEPLEGQLPGYGPERTARSGRTRMNARYLSETGAGSASGDDGRFTLAELEEAVMSMRSSLAEAGRDAVVARCTGAGPVDVGGQSVDITAGCAALGAWDGRYTVASKGAVLWREFLGSGVFEVADLNDGGGGLFATPFDPADPLGTPSGLVAAPAEGPDPVLTALATAVAALDAAGIAVDVALGDVQRMPFPDGQDFAVGGGTYWEGTIGIADWSGSPSLTLLDWPTRAPYANPTTERTTQGIYPMNNGNSFILAMGFDVGGPVARAVTTYSQSTDPASPHLRDQSAVYAAGTLREVFFDEDAVAEAAVEIETLTREEGAF